MKKTALTAFALSLIVPALVLAQASPNTTYVDTWLAKAISWLSQAITIIMVLMTVWFLIGVFRYIAEKDPGKLAEKRKVMLNGLIGLFIAVSVWGIISIAGNIFGTKYTDAPGLTCPPGTMVDPLTGRCNIR